MLARANGTATSTPTSDRNRQLALWLIGIYAALLPVTFTVALADGRDVLTGPSDLVLAVLIALCLPAAVVIPRAWSRWHVAVLLTPTVSGIGVLVLGRSLGISVALAKILGMVSLLLLYLIITSNVRSWTGLRRIAAAYVNAVIWLNLVATALFMAGIRIPVLNTYPDRLSGSNPDPNAYGGLLLVALALALPTQRSGDPLVKGTIARIALLAVPFSIMLTSSRSSWIGLGAILLVLGILRPRVWLRYVVAAAVVFVLVGVLAGPELATEQAELATRGTGHRVENLEAVSDSFWSSPIFGIGIGQFADRYGVIVHNTLAWWLGEFGIVGFTTIVGFLFTFLRWGWLTYRSQPEPNRSLALGLFTAFVAMSALSLGIEALYQRWWWLVMALIGSSRALSLGSPDSIDKRTISAGTYASRTRYYSDALGRGKKRDRSLVPTRSPISIRPDANT